MENSIIARFAQEQAFSTYRPHYSRVKPVTSDNATATRPKAASKPSSGSNPSAVTPSRSVSQPEFGSTPATPRAESPSSKGDSGPRPKGSASRPALVRDSIGMTRAELRMVQKLQRRENEVQAHEQAHIAAGGRFVQGGATYSYRMGPDGRMYAVGGEVSIDTSPVPGDPQATLQKALQIRRAALAPNEPSAQDLQAAAKASRMAARARAELRQEGSRESGANQGASSGQEVSRPFAGSGPVGSSGENRTQSLHAPPPPEVAKHAYLRQSGGEGAHDRGAGLRVRHRA